MKESVGSGGPARPKVRSFEDLRVYQASRQLTVRIYEVTQGGNFMRDRGLTEQIRRAGVSILSNIAEGYERDSDAEFVHYLRIAKGSCGEVRAQLDIASALKYLDGTAHAELRTEAAHIAGMLARLISHLRKRPDSKGKRPSSSSDSTK